MTCGTLLLLLRSIRNRWSAGSVPQGMNYRCACPSSQCGRSSVLFYSFKDGTADAPGEYMADWIARQMQEMGYIGIALLMFLENLFPPIPSEVIMPMDGMAVANGDLNMAGVIRPEEHTSELQSLMRISYAIFSSKKKTRTR